MFLGRLGDRGLTIQVDRSVRRKQRQCLRHLGLNDAQIDAQIGANQIHRAKNGRRGSYRCWVFNV